MSLLREIQEMAINSEAGLPTLLRKCKVLAARLGNSEFKQWVENELNGYDSRDTLPSYRIINVNSKGNFSGAFGSGLDNADIPMSCIPKKFHESLKHSYLMQPIASIEALANSSKTTNARETWNPDLVAHVGQKIYQHMNCLQAWKVIPNGAIIAVLDSVRNRILSFVLEIEAEAPDAGDAPINSNPVPQERVHQIFNTIINGNVQNVATGSKNISQKAKHIEQNSDELFLSMLDVISKSELEQNLISELQDSIQKMRSSQGSSDFTNNYQGFMSILADHIQVIGPILAPYLPALSVLLT